MFKANGDTLVECAHSLMAPQNGLQGASGGIMIQDERNEIKLIIVCGGKVVFIESFGVKVDNSECFQLNSDGLSSRTNIGIKVSAPQVGSLRFEGRGSGASLVLGHGKSRLWITGGASLQDGSVYTTEFVHFANEINVDHGGYLMNEQGPDLPSTGLDNHCLAKIVPEAAILIGGQLKIHGEDSRVIGRIFVSQTNNQGINCKRCILFLQGQHFRSMSQQWFGNSRPHLRFQDMELPVEQLRILTRQWWS